MLVITKVREDEVKALEGLNLMREQIPDKLLDSWAKKKKIILRKRNIDKIEQTKLIEKVLNQMSKLKVKKQVISIQY